MAAHSEINKRVTQKGLRKLYGHVSADMLGYCQADLMDMSTYKAKKGNGGYAYGLVIIDIRSRYGWCIPMKNKSADTCGDAVNRWLAGLVQPVKIIKIYTDAGSEFHGEFNRVLKKWGVVHDENKSTFLHQVLAERLIRTIKERIREYWVRDNNFNWVGHIGEIMDWYNGRVQAGVGAKPKDIWEGTNGRQSQAKTVVKPTPTPTPDLLVGDHVRILTDKTPFDKPSLTPNYSEKVYTIRSFVGSMYTLDNGHTYPRWKLMKSVYLPSMPKSRIQSKVKVVKRKKRVKAQLKREGIKVDKVVREKREKKLPGRYKEYVLT